MLRVIGRDLVAQHLDYAECIRVVRGAMAALSAGRTKQMLRQITPIDGGNVLSAMAGVMPPEVGFGAKVISVFPTNSKRGRQSHQGVVVLFDAESGEPISVLHAGRSHAFEPPQLQPSQQMRSRIPMRLDWRSWAMASRVRRTSKRCRMFASSRE